MTKRDLYAEINEGFDALAKRPSEPMAGGMIACPKCGERVMALPLHHCRTSKERLDVTQEDINAYVGSLTEHPTPFRLGCAQIIMKLWAEIGRFRATPEGGWFEAWKVADADRERLKRPAPETDDGGEETWTSVIEGHRLEIMKICRRLGWDAREFIVDYGASENGSACRHEGASDE
jgi:hypothetical protein